MELFQPERKLPSRFRRASSKAPVIRMLQFSATQVMTGTTRRVRGLIRTGRKFFKRIGRTEITDTSGY
jgi:hypothetical protein